MGHVFVIMMENTSYDDLLSPSNQNTKFIQQLAANNGLANNYFGVTHDSLPNYIAATSGRTGVPTATTPPRRRSSTTRTWSTSSRPRM